MVVPAPDTTPAFPLGSPVALGQKVRAGDVTVTPVAVVEDSRCPIDARCVWPGRLVVRARLQIANWGEIIEVELGKNYHIHGRGITLASSEPGRSADRATPLKDYRFTFDRA